MLSAGTTAAICQLQALSPDGRCKTFDATADGYGRGEGVAVVVLQPALAASPAQAIVLGSAVNQVARNSSVLFISPSPAFQPRTATSMQLAILVDMLVWHANRNGRFSLCRPCLLMLKSRIRSGWALKWLDSAKWAEPICLSTLSTCSGLNISRSDECSIHSWDWDSPW